MSSKQVKTPEKTITHILKEFKQELGDDFDAYHNHAQRVYYYSKTLLLMKENRKLGIAAAFHDLDIWESQSMDYLSGSADLANAYMSKNDLRYLPDEMTYIISNHHKLNRISGNIEAEAFRKADIIDLSGGLIHFNIPKSLVMEAESKYPRLGFSKTIFLKTIKYALAHIFNPFPMIKL